MKPDRLSHHEREALGRFLWMTRQDVGARAAEFEASHAAAVAEEVPGAHELVAREHLEAAQRWRELERLLDVRGLGRVGELREREQMRWAQRLKALSEAFGRPDPSAPVAVEEEALRPPREDLSVPGASLDSESFGARVFDVKRLGRMRDPAWAPALIRVLREDPEEGVRAAAARALGSVGGEQARAALLEVEPGSAGTRRAIAVSLGLLRERDAVPRLIGWLTDEGARYSAVKALGRIGDPGAVPALERVLPTGGRSDRSAVRRALLAIGHPDAIEALRRHPRRSPLARARDSRAAERAMARHRARERHEIPRLDRAVRRQCLRAMRATVTTSGFAIAPIALLDAPVRPLLTAAAVVALILGAVVVSARGWRDDSIDLARWRVEDGAGPGDVAPGWVTALRVFTNQPLAPVGLWLGGIFAAEAVTGASGIVAGAFCGLGAAAILGIALRARSVSRWERDAGVRLLVDGARGPEGMDERRLFSVPR